MVSWLSLTRARAGADASRKTADVTIRDKVALRVLSTVFPLLQSSETDLTPTILPQVKDTRSVTTFAVTNRKAIPPARAKNAIVKVSTGPGSRRVPESRRVGRSPRADKSGSEPAVTP